MLLHLLLATFTLVSPSFKEGETLSNDTVLNALDCHGPSISPALNWSDAPAGTKSFALVLDDYEARGNRPSSAARRRSRESC